MAGFQMAIIGRFWVATEANQPVRLGFCVRRRERIFAAVTPPLLQCLFEVRPRGVRQRAPRQGAIETMFWSRFLLLPDLSAAKRFCFTSHRMRIEFQRG